MNPSGPFNAEFIVVLKAMIPAMRPETMVQMKMKNTTNAVAKPKKSAFNSTLRTMETPIQQTGLDIIDTIPAMGFVSAGLFIFCSSKFIASPARECPTSALGVAANG